MKRKKTLKEKMLLLFMLCAMTSLLAAGFVSYMALRMIQENSIEDNMKLCLNQITRDTDSAYYDMLSIANQMKPGGLVGNVTEDYLGTDDNYERFVRQRSLREELIGLGYMNTELIGVSYYDLGEKQELVGNMNIRELDESYVSLPRVVECAGNIMQAVHPSHLGIDDRPALSVRREVVFGNGRKLDIYVEIEANMEAPEELNKEEWPYTYIHMDQDGIARYSTNPVIIRGQQLFPEPLSKGEYDIRTQEGYKIMAYRSKIGYINAVALPDNVYQKEIHMWRLKMLAVIAGAFLIFSLLVVYLYRLICRPLNQFRVQMVRIGEGALQEVHQESEIAEFDSLLREVEQMKRQIEHLISSVVEKEKSIQRTEYEKLLYQINPHFLLNTLNSVQWMAQMSRQRDISEFVHRLKKLLSYNLGKEGRRTTLRMELDIIKDYIALQQMRYDFTVEMHVEDGDYLDQPAVRMLFQPLVENAIRYGLGEDEKISIQVFEDTVRKLAVITISDSGNGLTQEEIDQINESFDYDWENKKGTNRGIGLRYVKAMLESFYEGETSLFVNSRKGRGTKITILIPVRDGFCGKDPAAEAQGEDGGGTV
ncbi:MAG: histidine kinase [Dorea sp.]|nr:histidine kinase [Dorea sp.]